MRHKLVLRFSDVEMKQLQMLAKAFNVDEKRAAKECIGHGFQVYVRSLKEAAAKHLQQKETIDGLGLPPNNNDGMDNGTEVPMEGDGHGEGNS